MLVRNLEIIIEIKNYKSSGKGEKSILYQYPRKMTKRLLNQNKKKMAKNIPNPISINSNIASMNPFFIPRTALSLLVSKKVYL